MPKKQINKQKILKLFLLLCFYLYIFRNIAKTLKSENSLAFFKKKLKIGVVSVRHDINAGNLLLKYAIHIVLSKLGFTPYIIATHYNNYNLTFINKTTNLVVIYNNFSEIKRDDYDILMVNSDQTWRKLDEHFFDYAFLKFAENWSIKKFVYGASLGFEKWPLTPEGDKIAKRLLKNFIGISVREEGSIKVIQKHLNVTPEVVLDPTLLIDKQYYLDLIKGYSNGKFNSRDNFIVSYKVTNSKTIKKFAYKATQELGYKLYILELNNNFVIEDLIYLIVNSKAVISDSFHGYLLSRKSAVMSRQPKLSQ